MILHVISAAWLGLVPAATFDEPKPEDVLLGGDARKRYLLHGPAKPASGRDAAAPAEGWRLLVVMPGGPGNAEFAPFVGRIRENALGKEWLIAQIVAPVWDAKQAETNVWPTKLNPWPKMEFTCEELFAAVVEDVGKKRKLDPRYLFTLAWSSSGTLAYTLALDKETKVTGSFVAMSVFKPNLLPPLSGAKGRRFFISHSPTDFIPIAQAEQARDDLAKNGAQVEYATYEGGHGWQGDVYGGMKKGLRWLEERAAKPGKAAKGKPGK